MGAPTPSAMLDKVGVCPMGMNSGADPTVLQDFQQSFACNLTFRGAHPKTRPPMVKIPLTFESDEIEGYATETLFQDAGYYEGFPDADGGSSNNCLLLVSGGRVFRIAITNQSGAVQNLSGTDLNNPTRPQAWMFQGEEFMVINDGQALPWFFYGSGMRRSLGPDGQELPPGCMGHYVNGRISMVLPDRRSFIAGDLVTGPSGTATYGYRDAILKITENLAILGGRSFAVPLTAGAINAMFSVAIPDTSLGQGPLQVGTRKGVFSIDLPLDATQWTTTLQPSSAVSLPSFGPTSHSSVSVVNGDAWYRAKDGLRSFVVARRDMATSWVQTAKSFELNEILPYDTQHLLGFASSVIFDERLLCTCSPHRVIDRGIAHRGLVALDFNNISSLTMAATPSYDGLWTGLEILKIVEGEFAGVERCFIFALDAENKICLYELLSTTTQTDFDHNGTEDVLTECWLVSNALFGRETLPPQITLPLKSLKAADLFLEGLAGDIDFSVQYRPDQWPFWVDWKDFEFCAPATECAVDCEQPQEIQRQYATRLRLPEPIDECNQQTKRQMRTGYHFQVKLQWEGRVTLHDCLFWATPVVESQNNVCTTEACQVVSGCVGTMFTYSIE